MTKLSCFYEVILLLELSLILPQVLAYGSLNWNREAVNQLAIWRATNASTARATNLHGFPVPSLTASQAIGTRGHVLLQDFTLLEKLGSFNRERIPERVVHARGTGAHGYFEVTHDVSRFTKAKFLNGIGKRTPTFVRFSTAVGERGSADTVVDHLGFATKFYTEEGNHDLLNINMEVLAIRDAMLFSDLNRARKKNPQTNMADENMVWDYASYRPEALLQILQLFSDRGRPDGFRRIDGFSVNAFKLVNEDGGVVFAKLNWLTLTPKKFLTFQRAEELTAKNPDYMIQDLFDAIAEGNYPAWDLYLQVMTLEQARKYRRSPFDITKAWDNQTFPFIPVGRMVLNRNPLNHFAEVEQAAFAPSNLVPGIEPSPDRSLAARIFAYRDTQVYRLGVNFAQLPINRPLSPVNSYMRDGFACHGDNGGGSPNYYPNSFGGPDQDTEGARQVRFSVEGIVDRFDVPEEDELAEARDFIDQMGSDELERLIESMADRLRRVREEIRERVYLNLLYPLSTEFGNAVKKAVAIALKRNNSY